MEAKSLSHQLYFPSHCSPNPSPQSPLCPWYMLCMHNTMSTVLGSSVLAITPMLCLPSLSGGTTFASLPLDRKQFS